MFKKLNAWRELFRLEHLKGLRGREHAVFFRGNIIRTLKEEGLFDFLSQPHTFDEIISEFGFTDKVLLEEVLNALVKDETLSSKAGLYQVIKVDDRWDPAENYFDEGAREIWMGYGKAFPARLKGKQVEFASGFNLFNWDEALTKTVYEVMRRSSFAFVDVFKKPGKFLDVGCGNGYGTAVIWTYYLNKGLFNNSSGMKIIGVDPNNELLDIARNEFPRMVATYIQSNERIIKDLKKSIKGFQGAKSEIKNILDSLTDYYPDFHEGKAEGIPFPDNTFDYVFTSQVLHWTNVENAIAEMLRVLKPRGILFGNEPFLPDIATPFMDFHLKVVEGECGYFTRDEFIKAARAAGAKNIRTATPISVFKMTK